MHNESFYISGLPTFLHKTYMICICSEKVVVAENGIINKYIYIYIMIEATYTPIILTVTGTGACTDHVIDPLLLERCSVHLPCHGHSLCIDCK